MNLPISLRAMLSDQRGRWIFLVLCAVVLAIAALGYRSDQLTATATPTQTQASGGLNISFRDSATGYAVPTSFSAENQTARARAALVTDAAGRGRYQLAAGRHNLEVAARGYRPLKTHFEVDPQTPLAVTVWLDPLEPPEELRPEVVAAKLIPGYTMLHGHVANAQVGRPLAGVRIRLENAGVEAQTDERGYFLLYSLTPSVNPTEELPKTDHLMAEIAGFKTYRIANVLMTEGDAHFKIELEQGEGTIERDKGHKMLRSAEELKDTQRRPQESAADHHAPQLESRVESNAAQETSVPVPTSIRVGFNCSCATCSTVQVYTLDTYVRLGLDDEWISSWNSNSLKAGAIAFRSYGAYHVYHPRNVNYDICSTTCCQVIDPADSSVNTDNATSATSGIIVVNSAGTEPFFAEYAAENNDNFCADGFTGSPSFNWPCMNDFVDAGATFNGHGRGMCQWGTQRWAVNQARDWTWIVNHYYNDNGNPSGSRSGVLQTPAPDFSVSATPSSQTVAPGASVGYTVTIVPTNGFIGIVDFTVSGSPSGASVSFNPPSVNTSGSSTMTVTTSAFTPTGAYPLIITGTSGSLQRTTSVTLVVANPSADFSLSATPSSRSVRRNQSTTYTVTVTPLDGFTGAVTFGVTGLPGGANASFNPTSVTGSGTTTMTVTAGNPRGTFTLTIAGTSGSLQHNTVVTLTVTK